MAWRYTVHMTFHRSIPLNKDTVTSEYNIILTFTVRAGGAWGAYMRDKPTYAET